MNTKYSRMRIYLHWLSAIVIIWATFSGFYIFLGKPSADTKALISFINVSLTTCFIPFFILRVFYSLKHPSPPVAAAQQKTHKMAKRVHIVLYANISAVLITGVLMMDRAINVFNLFSIPAPFSNPAITHFFHSVHIFSCTTLALLVVMHILAVVKHQFSGHGIMHRMLP